MLFKVNWNVLKIKNKSIWFKLKLSTYIYRLIKIMEYSQGFNLANTVFDDFSIRLHEVDEKNIVITFVFENKTIKICRKKRNL